MTRLYKICAALILTVFFIPTPSFALDQLILKDGSIIEGTILAEVPNRHVDIQLVNGTKKRYAKADVQTIERDYPSNHTRKVYGQTSEIYLGAQTGLLLSLEDTAPGASSTFFTWGLRTGINIAQLGDFAKLATGISFAHAQTTQGTTTIADNQVLIQILFRKIGNSGFYFGPQFGLDFVSASMPAVTGSATATPFTFGLNTGYDFYFTDAFSIGPDVRYEHNGAADLTYNGAVVNQGQSSSALRFMLVGTFHL